MAAALERLNKPSFAAKPERTAAAARSSFARRRGPGEGVARRSTPRGPLRGSPAGAPPSSLRRREEAPEPRRAAGRAKAPSIGLGAQLGETDGWIQSADGMESTSFVGQLVTIAPTRLMLFIDGSWLYYSMCVRSAPPHATHIRPRRA